MQIPSNSTCKRQTPSGLQTSDFLQYLFKKDPFAIFRISLVLVKKGKSKFRAS